MPCGGIAGILGKDEKRDQEQRRSAGKVNIGFILNQN
jgi:hypothetical protein